MISVFFFHERSITMSTNNKNLHLTDQDIIIIEKGIENGPTKTAITLTLGKDKSTIGKGIISRRFQTYKSSYNPACANKDECSHNHVCSGCPDFKPFKCYICPIEIDLKKLGLNCQEKADLMVSHINSQSKENLKAKSPLEMMEFLNSELYKRFLLIYNRVVDKMKVVYPFYESVIIKKPKKVNV